jgi:hypothetical protein
MLVRHWTLFDAFAYSSYVAPRMQTWRPGGREALALLFAHMGLSLEQAKTEYSERARRAARGGRLRCCLRCAAPQGVPRPAGPTPARAAPPASLFVHTQTHTHARTHTHTHTPQTPCRAARTARLARSWRRRCCGATSATGSSPRTASSCTTAERCVVGARGGPGLAHLAWR